MKTLVDTWDGEITANCVQVGNVYDISLCLPLDVVTARGRKYLLSLHIEGIMTDTIKVTPKLHEPVPDGDKEPTLDDVRGILNFNVTAVDGSPLSSVKPVPIK